MKTVREDAQVQLWNRVRHCYLDQFQRTIVWGAILDFNSIEVYKFEATTEKIVCSRTGLFALFE